MTERAPRHLRSPALSHALEGPIYFRSECDALEPIYEMQDGRFNLSGQHCSGW
jgi:hypothetical protein